jgi:TP901 family phage tail tape measure protein
MATLATLVVKLTADTSAFQSGLQKARGAMDSAAQGMRSVGAALTKSVTLPLAGIGAGAIAAAVDVDEGLDRIRAGTGATGEALAALEKDFNAVARSVPADLGDVGTAIADLNTRTGQTGEGLQDLARQTLELARLQESDLGATIASTTRLFGDWAVSTEDQAATLDKLFRASQATGAGVTELADQVVQFGAPLRQFGFSLEESVAILGKFETEGVNIETVMSGLRQGLARLAASGREPVEAFRETVEAIKSTGSTAEANRLALELFGARAGPDMAAAIREGRFSIDELVESISSGGDSILKAAADTEDFAHKWLKVKNSLKIAAAPFGEALLKSLEELTPHLTKFAEFLGKLAEGFGKLPTPVQALILGIFGLAAAAGPVLAVLGSILPVLGALLPALAVLTGPIGLVVAAIVGLGAALVLAWRNSETFRDVVTGVWNTVKAAGVAAFEGIKSAVEALGRAWDWLVGVAERAFGALRDFFGPIAEEIRETIDVRLIQPVKELWSRWGDDLMAIAELAWSGIKAALEIQWGAISAAAELAWSGIANVFSTAWEIIKSLVSGALTVISNTIQLGLNLIQGDWAEAWENVKGIFGGVKDALLGTVTALWDGIETGFSIGAEGVKGLLRGLFDGIAEIWNSIKSTAVTIVTAMWEAIKGVFSRAIGEIRAKMGQVQDAVVGAWSKIKSVVVGSSIVPEMWDLIVQTFEAGLAETQARMEAGKERLIGIWQDVKTGIIGALDGITGGMASKIGGAFEALDGLLGGKIGDLVGKVGGALTGGLGGVFESLAGFMGGPWGAAIMGALDVLGIDIGAAVGKIVGTIGKGIKALGEGIGDLLGIGGHSDLGVKEKELFGQEVFSIGTTFTDSYQRADAKIKALPDSWRAALSEIVVATQPIMESIGEDWRAIAEAAQTFQEQGLSVDQLRAFFDQLEAGIPVAEQMQKFLEDMATMPPPNIEVVPVESIGDQVVEAGEVIQEGFEGISGEGVGEFVGTFEENLVGGMDNAFGELERSLEGVILSDLIRVLQSMADRAATEFLRTFAARIATSAPVVVPTPVVGQPSTGGGGPNFEGRGPAINVTVVDDRPIELDGKELGRVVSDELGKFLLLHLGPMAS